MVTPHPAPSSLSLLIPRCSAVHTWFMRSPIDLVFLDDDGLVLSIHEHAPKWRTYSGPRGTRAVLELPPGRARDLDVSQGDRVSYDPSGLARSGDRQLTEVMTRFSEPLRITVSDVNGRARPEVTVRFAVHPGPTGASGTFGGETKVRTNARGIATAPPLTANGVSGTFVIHVTAGRRSTTFELTNVPGAPASIETLEGGGQGVAAGSAYPLRPRVIVLDAFGNAVAGAAVRFDCRAGARGAAVVFRGLPLVTTDANGVAASPMLFANRKPGACQVVATVDGAEPAVFPLKNDPPLHPEKRALAWAAVALAPVVVGWLLARRS